MTRRALISVSDKTGISELARNLAELGFEIISTGGTARTLREGGVSVKDVSQVTGFQEMLDGRVKTLHPKIHGGILARRNDANHIAQVKQNDIGLIDLVVVNLYPFVETVAQPDVTIEEAIEQIDIGGPTLIRASAKNFQHVTVVVDPSDYSQVLTELDENGDTSESLRKRLATKAFAHTAACDCAIHQYLSSSEPFPDSASFSLTKIANLRYGENPHQAAAVYRWASERDGTVATAKQLSGKEVSYNNYQDADAAWQLVLDFGRPAAAIIKHANPCGCAEAETLSEAMQKAWEADPISRFGGVIACNRVIDTATADVFLAPQNKFDVIIAPGYEPEALERIKQRKGWGGTICILEVSLSKQPGNPTGVTQLSLRQIDGGLLLQDADQHQLQRSDLRVVTRRQPTEAEMDDLLFAWKVVKNVKSNAIVIAKQHSLLGMGAGQPNRVTSVELALKQGGEKVKGGALSSDAFFPFPDGPEIAAKAGVTAIIQPGGSVKDDEVIAAMDVQNVAMVFTGVRHFRH